VIAKLQEQLLAQERELDSLEGTVVTWEESLTAFACAHGEPSVECDASHACANAIWWDYSAQVSAFCSHFGRLNALSRTPQERMTLLGL
jgi:hypothetical protein